MQTKRDFFNEAVKNLKSSGSILPSSKFLMKRMLESIDYNTTTTVVEFGPGNGIFTKAIIQRRGKKHGVHTALFIVKA